MNLNSVFNEENIPQAAGNYVNQNVAFDRTKESTEFIKFQFLQDWDEMTDEVIVSHYVENVGSVKCNLHPIPDRATGRIYLWNGVGKDKDTGKRVNKKPEHACVFCQEKNDAVNAVTDREGSLSEGSEAAKLHNRTQQLFSPVRYEVLSKKKGSKKPEVIKELTEGLLKIRINDLFSDKGRGSYFQLKNFYDLKGTLLDHWFVMNAQGNISPDDGLKDSERDLTHEVDVAGPKERIKTYAEGKAKYLARKGEANKAVAVTLDDDETIPF